MKILGSSNIVSLDTSDEPLLPRLHRLYWYAPLRPSSCDTAGSAEDQPEDVMIAEIVRRCFPELAERRRREAVEDRNNLTEVLPIFYCESLSACSFPFNLGMASRCHGYPSVVVGTWPARERYIEMPAKMRRTFSLLQGVLRFHFLPFV